MASISNHIGECIPARHIELVVCGISDEGLRQPVQSSGVSTSAGTERRQHDILRSLETFTIELTRLHTEQYVS